MIVVDASVLVNALADDGEEGGFAHRIWQLRDNLTAYDAVYVALAETLACPLVTVDQRLANAPGTSCAVEVLAC